jgi:hypothetical protein
MERWVIHIVILALRPASCPGLTVASDQLSFAYGRWQGETILHQLWVGPNGWGKRDAWLWGKWA